jgi:hypothetical protein
MDLYLPLDGEAVLALSIPTKKCETLARHPLRWLRFLGYAVYGQEGEISLSCGGKPVLDYRAKLEPRAYHFVSPRWCPRPWLAARKLTWLDLPADPPRLVDPDGIARKSPWPTSPRDGKFRAEVSRRYGVCMMSGAPPASCQAAHLIPHAKGDRYMANLAWIRGGSNGGLAPDRMDRIDDPQNGFFAHSLLHHQYDHGGCVAFLKVGPAPYYRPPALTWWPADPKFRDGR